MERRELRLVTENRENARRKAPAPSMHGDLLAVEPVIGKGMEYYKAMEVIATKASCRDLRELLKIIPSLFEDVTKVTLEIKTNNEPQITTALFHRVRDGNKITFKNGSEHAQGPTIPLEAAGQNVGKMDVEGLRSLTPEQFEVLRVLGSLIARTFEDNLDNLTALSNRRLFGVTLAENVANFIRDGTNFSLIMVDVDHFKKVNDTYGHDAGDKVLRAIARALYNTTRDRDETGGAEQDIDVVARYGGEEFAVVLSNTSAGEAVKVAERIRTEIEGMSVKISPDISINVTCSLGVADSRDASLTDEVIAAGITKIADTRLYKAKAAGRNRVVSTDC